jgi:hypothetical protein
VALGARCALTWAMHLTLLVPGLLWPREILRDTTFDLPLPALSLLLGRGRRTPLTDMETWLGATFGLPAPLPSAPLRLLGDGGVPGEDHWLCLDPVHLRVEQRALMVDVPTRLALGAEEDAALRDSMAALFDGEFVAPAAGRWHLRLSMPPAIETLPLHQAVGRPAPPDLPGGPDGPRWRHLLSQAQPLLHAHAVNRSRDDAGLPTINSLWPWGSGRLPSAARRAFDRLLADEPLLRGLGVLAGIETHPLPKRFSAGAGTVLASFEQLSAPAASFDALAWREALTALEAEWLTPALSALRSGACRSITLIAEGNGQTMEVTTDRHDLLRFWRKPLALAELAT